MLIFLSPSPGSSRSLDSKDSSPQPCYTYKIPAQKWPNPVNRAYEFVFGTYLQLAHLISSVDFPTQQWAVKEGESNRTKRTCTMNKLLKATITVHDYKKRRMTKTQAVCLHMGKGDAQDQSHQLHCICFLQVA